MKPKIKQLKNLLYSIAFPIELIGSLAEPDIVNEWGFESKYWNSRQNKINLANYLEIKRLIEVFNISIEELHLMGQEIRSEKLAVRRKMKSKPIQSRRDNKDVRVGSGGSNRSKVRFPKKVRKTAWKRFYKLFPHLKPE